MNTHFVFEHPYAFSLWGNHWSCHIILIKYQIPCWYEKVTLLFSSFIFSSTLMVISQVESLPSSEYQLFWLRNLVINTKQIFLDRHSLHVKLHQWIRRWKIKQYINHICRAISVYFIASKLEMSNCNTYIFLMFRA